MFGDIGGTLKSIQHHYSHFNYIFSGSDLVVCEGTSEGEHRDGSWRAACRSTAPAAGAMCRDSRLEDSSLLHLSRSGLCRQRHGALSVAEEQMIVGLPFA